LRRWSRSWPSSASWPAAFLPRPSTQYAPIYHIAINSRRQHSARRNCPIPVPGLGLRLFVTHLQEHAPPVIEPRAGHEPERELCPPGEVGVPLLEPVTSAADELNDLGARQLGQAGDELDPAAAVADNGDLLVGVVEVTPPPEVVEIVTLERLEPGDLGKLRSREGPVGRDEDVGGGGVRWAFLGLKGEGVLLSAGIPGRRDVARVVGEPISDAWARHEFEWSVWVRGGDET